MERRILTQLRVNRYLWFRISGDDTLKTGVVALHDRPTLERLYEERLDGSTGAGPDGGRVDGGRLDQ